jgi:outer membrane protein insertion porin family
VFSKPELFEQMSLKSGQIFNRTLLRKDIDKIIDLYMERGYARADINPLINVNAEEKTADITLSVTEGNIFRIGRIDISGNTKTRDKVIRREMRLDEGNIFNKKLLKRSYQRINNLNYFDNVDVKPNIRTEDHLVDIDIDVKEKLTGMLSIGGGYSSIDRFMVMGEITQTNLFGRGLYLKLRADLSSRRTNYNLSLRDPWFMDKPLSVTFSVYNEEIEYLDYDKKATGGSIGVGKELYEYVGLNITYNIEQAEIINVSSGASTIIKDQEGEKLTSSISPSIWRDTRNNYMDPTSGSKNSLYLTLAGLGGDNYYWKSLADSLWYFPAFWDVTFSMRGRLGYATGYKGEKLPLYERFYVGGINTIRGLGFGEGGPRDETGEKIGGNWEAIANAELIFPLIDDIKLKGVLFYDYGGAFDEDQEFSSSFLRKTTGFGVRWMSPFGPIRLEWGFNLDPKFDEGDNKIEFSMGGVF